MIILERELTNARGKIVQLEELARSLETDKKLLKNNLREYQRELAEKEEQLNEIMGMKIFISFSVNMYVDLEVVDLNKINEREQVSNIGIISSLAIN